MPRLISPLAVYEKTHPSSIPLLMELANNISNEIMTLSANSTNTDSFGTSLKLLSNTTVARYIDTTTASIYPKVLGAKLLKPGFNCPSNNLKLVEWPKGIQKPVLNELRNRIIHCVPNSKPRYYDVDKCISMLLKIPNVNNIDIAIKA